MNKPQETARLPEHLKIFRRVDLNLFIIFATIYELGSVTAAAKALGLSQPAVSHALSRLRGTLNDELFIRHGTSLAPSPFAKSIIDDVLLGLNTFRLGPLGSDTFKPIDSRLEFRIAMGVSMEIFLLPLLLERLSKEAPHVSISSIRIDRKDITNELAGGSVNLAIDNHVPHSFALRSHTIGSSKLVTVTRKNNPIVKHGLNKENYLNAKHILMRTRNGDGGIEDYQISKEGEKRHIIAQCSALTSALRTVACTDYMVTLGRDQLDSLSKEGEFSVFDFPFGLPRLEAYLLWHESTESDPANRWIRQIILDQFSNTVKSPLS